MVKSVSLLFIAAFVLGASSVPSRQRRQFEWGNNFDSNNVINGGNNGNAATQEPPTSATTEATTTRASETFRRCMEDCKTTQQYNPVCGDNGETYHNHARLQCASLCGRNVAFFRQGTCQPL